MKISQWSLQDIPPFPSSDFQVLFSCPGTHYTKQMIKKNVGNSFMYVFCIMFSVGTGGIYNLAHLNKTLNFNAEVLLKEVSVT